MTTDVATPAAKDSPQNPEDPTPAAAEDLDASPASDVVQESGAEQPKKRSKVLRGVMTAAVAFTAWHIFASFLWIAPVSPLREVVPGKLLTQYMIPFFGQSWSVFAPEPINGDNRMLVRAVVRENGADKTTEWVNVTDVETQLMTNQLFPARAANQTIDLASAYRSAYANLTQRQQDAVNQSFFAEGWADSVSAKLSSLDDNPATVGAYINVEFRAVRYATQAAKAIWGQNVVRVQFQMERQNVIPFEERHNPEAQRPKVQLTPTGWRGLQVAKGQSEKDFADTFKRLYKELQP